MEKKNNIAVYTAIFGDYDKLIIPEKEIEGCDFYCFTDNKKLQSDFYKIIQVEGEFSDPTRNARKIKILSHKYLPEYEYTLWIDANICFREFDVKKMFNNFLANHDIAIHKHNVRDCVYNEFSYCTEIEIDSPAIMANQIVRYIKEDYPINNGLVETGVLFRRNTKSIKKINEDWWNEIKNGSKRDQLSICYVIWKNKIDYFMIEKSIRKGNLFYIENHSSNNYPKRARTFNFNELEKKILEIEGGICKKCYIEEKNSNKIQTINCQLKEMDQILKKKEAEINYMKSSKFWKLRNLYLKIRK